jgi:transposase
MIAVGVDTHEDRHHAVALDQVGRQLGELAPAADAAGYAELQLWAERLGGTEEIVFGIEGAGSFGAGLCRHLQQAGHSVVEVERPRRVDRRAGKSDRIDALAARRVLEGSVSIPRRHGILSAIRALLVARRSAVGERTRVLASCRLSTSPHRSLCASASAEAPVGRSSAGSSRCGPALASTSRSASPLR